MLHLNEIYSLGVRFYLSPCELEELQLAYLLSNKKLTKPAIYGLYKKIRQKSWSSRKQANFKVFGKWINCDEFSSFFYYIEDWIESNLLQLEFDLSVYLNVVMRTNNLAKSQAKSKIEQRFSRLISSALHEYIRPDCVNEYGLDSLSTTFDMQIPCTPTNYPASYWNLVEEEEFSNARRYSHLSCIQDSLLEAAIHGIQTDLMII